MGDSPRIPSRTEEYEETLGVATRLGDLLIQTPRCVVRATDAPGYSTMLAEDGHDRSNSRVLLMLYDMPAGGATEGNGLVAQMTPDQARHIAGSLLRLASTLDRHAGTRPN